MIPVYEPDLQEEDIEIAYKALKSTWISSLGEYKAKAAGKLAEISGVRHALLVNNGTSATHLLAHAIKYRCRTIQSIIVPDNVYVAAWNAFQYGPKFDLIPIETDLETWNVNVERLIERAKKEDPEQTAILIVHNLGNPVNVPEISKELPGYTIVEDNCEGFLGSYGGDKGPWLCGGEAPTGSECLASSVSFYGNKNITCGEGGAVLTNDPKLYEHLYMLHTQGQTQRFIHGALGYNYRMTNIQAAILSSQLKRYEEIYMVKNTLFLRMARALSKCNILPPKMHHRCSHAYWMFGIRIPGSPGYERARLFLREHGVDSRPMFYPMSMHAHLFKYANLDNEENALLLSKECVILPSSPKLTEEQADQVTQAVIKYVEQL